MMKTFDIILMYLLIGVSISIGDGYARHINYGPFGVSAFALFWPALILEEYGANAANRYYI